MSTPPFTNRLIHEKSPYLLQHAHNPVDWYPWGKEAFDLAKKLDKPIFLSIGYATCHWCHVMERESFENPQIAALMNAQFINIKVDREELPQVDSIYMEFAQALMGSAGGWPLNLILTPDLKPFFAVTYLPPVNRRGLVGMEQFIQHIGQLWASEERSGILEQACRIVEILQGGEIPCAESLPTEETLLVAAQKIYGLIDPLNGGFQKEPKFPMGYQSQFLIQLGKYGEEEEALFCAQLTLDKMGCGGIYDHLGGGFSRYAIDSHWILPHFEKMLYDNALLSRAYLDGWKYFKKGSYRSVCEETLDYILSEMTYPGGGFYTGEDADSEGREGLFYTWTPEEVREVLTPEQADLFCTYYGVTPEGDIEGRSVLHVSQPLETLSSEQKELLFQAKGELKKWRMRRIRPFKDDKILVSWNGLMIDAMARAGTSLKKPEYLESAVRAAEFIQTHLWKEGQLFRRWRENQTRFPGGLEDYAFLIKGVITLFEEGCGSKWLQMALELEKSVRAQFKAEEGGFYSSQEDPFLLLRKQEYYDGAEPSGNGVHCENLLRLYQLTGDPLYLTGVEEILKGAAHFIDTYPLGACYHLMNLQRYLDTKAQTIVVALDEEKSLKEEIQEALSRRFIPHTGVVWKPIDDSLLCSLIPSLVAKNPIDGQTAVYICSGEHCSLPLVNRAEIFEGLEQL